MKISLQNKDRFNLLFIYKYQKIELSGVNFILKWIISA